MSSKPIGMMVIGAGRTGIQPGGKLWRKCAMCGDWVPADDSKQYHCLPCLPKYRRVLKGRARAFDGYQKTILESGQKRTGTAQEAKQA